MRIPIRRRLPCIKYFRNYNNANFTGINTDLENFESFFKVSALQRTVEQNILLYKHKIKSLSQNMFPLFVYAVIAINYDILMP